ncbi:hypothetical protein V8F06_014387 [Rhypophila decipiens]
MDPVSIAGLVASVVEAASMLLKEAPDIDALDDSGRTALSVAIERGFEKAVEFLIDCGALVNLLDVILAHHLRDIDLLQVQVYKRLCGPFVILLSAKQGNAKKQSYEFKQEPLALGETGRKPNGY